MPHSPAPLRARCHPDCYPSEPSAALAFFRAALEKFPAVLEDESTQLRGIITPHIDFRVSLASYAAAFRPLLALPLAETYLILGVGHRSHLEWNLDSRDYETPLGRAECARKRLEILYTSDALYCEPAGHVGEHSIEFPLVWLQALHALRAGSGDEAKPVRFIPLLCGGLHGYLQGSTDDLSDLHDLAEGVRALLADETVRVIVSIDGCHLGPRFGHRFRVNPAILNDTERWEDELWAVVESGHGPAFLEWMRSEGNARYFDGIGALALLLFAGEERLRPSRTYYEQWFKEEDTSAVTFSSGRIDS